MTFFKEDTATVTNPSIAVELMKAQYTEIRDHEEFWVVFLNSCNTPIGKKMITCGTINTTLYDKRRVVKEALMCNATRVILYHNHPSGHPTPSTADVKATEELKDACKLFDIDIMDHIIFAGKSYYSFNTEEISNFS